MSDRTKDKTSDKIRDKLRKLYQRWDDIAYEEQQKWYGNESSIYRFLDDLEEIINDEELFNGQQNQKDV